MAGDFVPILVLLIMALIVAGGALFIAIFVGPRQPSPVKQAPYESGMTPIGQAVRRLPIRFYLIATLFIIFDVEVIFFYPWAVVFRKLALFGLIEMLVFIAILLVGYVYIWKKGALEWE
jgi:NADH-quinone oxidoreductase subunit A